MLLEIPVMGSVALMVAVAVLVAPVLSAVARPFVPAVLLIVAALVFDESQVTDDVRSDVVVSWNVP